MINVVDALARNGRVAMSVARVFVSFTGYGLASVNDVEQVQQRSQQLLRAQPFLRGPDASIPNGNWVPEWNTFGDEGLVQVTAALARNYHLEAAPTNSMRGGYSPRFVASAAYLISSALDEWKTGTFAEGVMTFKRKNIEKWIQFRNTVDGYALNGSTDRNLPTFNEKPIYNVGILTLENTPQDDMEEASDVSQSVVDLELMYAREVIAGSERKEEEARTEVQAVEVDEERMEEQRERRKEKKQAERRRKRRRMKGGERTG
ncbi:hypothetical protein BDP27DRAFT_1451615 [Rhodocollybia butyracea]|uniref:Uncharacterized protein n=1 Tax=Rhodocollybia butyracea TaxID=206335 RepID=A0A9P5U1S5_9AGAR|nr:hypothetical protein BDP27DRAFT_1451615 [Rhodocollybia butyracea]